MLCVNGRATIHVGRQGYALRQGDSCYMPAALGEYRIKGACCSPGYERKMDVKKAALIMAGGRGERFWPRSRQNMPKQFLSLTDDGKTMIQLTVERILSLVAMEDIYVATNESYKELVFEQLPGIPPENVLCEPVGRNTAPCIGLGAVHIAKKHGDAVMIVLPSDHLIKHKALFLNALRNACEVAEQGSNLVTLGITPDSPETGYGYIKFIPEKTCGQALAVERFVEKPDFETAKAYLASEQYLWNSGMFIWKTSSILENLKEHLPRMYEGLLRIQASVGTKEQQQALEREFRAFQSVSIDYGVMEKAKDIYILSGSFGWDDVGSWLAVGRLKTPDEFGNVLNGNTVTVDTRNTIIQGEKKLIAAVGLENIIVVDTEDALLICEKNRAGDIKKVLENLRMCNRTQYL